MDSLWLPLFRNTTATDSSSYSSYSSSSRERKKERKKRDTREALRRRNHTSHLDLSFTPNDYQTRPTWCNSRSSPLHGPMSKTNVNYSWLKGTKCVNRAIYLTRVQPAKLNITCVCVRPTFPLLPFSFLFSIHPSVLHSFESSSLTRERERERLAWRYPGPIFASHEGSSRKMSIPETANGGGVALVVTFRAPRSVIADTRGSASPCHG